MFFRGQRLKILCFIGVILLSLIVLCYYSTTTINTKKHDTTIAISEPHLSHPSGFYKKPFKLEIKAGAGQKIYYTLDSSKPTSDSKLYRAPILIDDATKRPNVYANVREIAINDVVPPSYNLEKCQVVRAVTYDKDGNKGQETCASYFVGKSPSDFDGCNIVSLIVAPEDLFDSKRGIMVRGSRYPVLDALRLYNSNGYHVLLYTEALNYLWRGKKSERQAYFHFFDKQGAFLQGKHCGVRMHGWSTREDSHKAFSLFAREEYDGTSCFEHPFFGDGFLPSSIVLFSGGQDQTTFLKDYLVHSLIPPYKLKFDYYKFIPTVLFLNGEYWGFYWIHSRFDDAFISYYNNTHDAEISRVKIVPKFIPQSQGGVKGILTLNAYQDFLQFVQRADCSNDATYREICKKINIAGLIDYYATEIYIGNLDWPRHNVRLWQKSDDGEENLNYLWHYQLFDLQMAMEDSERNDLDYIVKNDLLFGSLWKNAQFRKQFETRLYFIADKVFEPKKVKRFLLNSAKVYKKALDKNWKRYSQDAFAKDFDNQLNIIINFFEERPREIRKCFSHEQLATIR